MAAADGSPGIAGNPIRVVVEVIARALVDHPDSVRQGRTAAALRTLVALTAEKHGVRAQLDIRD
jgi:predicted RNA-binding protein YlqC (UPF0109 family)